MDGANACQTGRRCVRQKREFEDREGFLGCSGVGLPAYPGHRPGVGCWHVDVGLRGGLRQNAPERKKAPKGLFSTTYRLRAKPVDLYLERETRLASGFRAVEIKGLSAFPETGIALILDSFLEIGK